MNNSPQWHLNLLARYPRPLAVGIIAAWEWMLETGFPVLIVIGWCFGIPAIVAAVTQSGLFGYAIAVIVLVLLGLAVIQVWHGVMDKYDEFNRRLPKREKPTEDQVEKEPA